MSNPRWDRYKRDSQLEHSKIRREENSNKMDIQKVATQIEEAVAKFNDWLAKGRDTQSSNQEVFVNFFKKAVNLDYTAGKAMGPWNVNPIILDRRVIRIEFNDSYWPQWKMHYLADLRSAVKLIDFKGIINKQDTSNFEAELKDIVKSIETYKF
jgi:hypothetical protein